MGTIWVPDTNFFLKSESLRCIFSISVHLSFLYPKYADFFSDTKIFIENGNSGRVIVQQFGINGTICADGWNDIDASVVCRSQVCSKNCFN